MDLSSAFHYSLLVGVLLPVISNAREGPEISRGMTAWGTMLIGASLLGWAATSKPVTGGAWAGLGLLVKAVVVVLGMVLLAWGWRRRRRDREVDAGLAVDRRADPLSRMQRQRAEHKLRTPVSPRSAAAGSRLLAVQAAAHAGRKRAVALSLLDAALMLAPMLLRSVREGTLDGSPSSLLAAGCVVLGALLVAVGRSRWVHHARREQAALDEAERTPSRP